MALNAAEYSLTSLRIAQIDVGRVSLEVEGYGLQRLQAIHGYLFGGIYEWAVQVRGVASSKRADNGKVSIFERPEHIESSWATLSGKTTEFVIAEGLGLQDQREALVSIYAEANRIHPFPEGNGRSLQTFKRQLVREQGLELDFTRTTAPEWNLDQRVEWHARAPFREAIPDSGGARPHTDTEDLR